jgi:hypothetical protein
MRGGHRIANFRRSGRTAAVDARGVDGEMGFRSGGRKELEGDGRRLGPQGGERFGSQPEVLEDLPRHIGLLDAGDEAHLACLANRDLRPGDTALITVPLCTQAAPGDPWTVVVDVDDDTTPPAVAGGRVLPSFFPLEAWPKSSECPFPVDGARPDLWSRHRDAGFDTLFLYWDGTCDFHGRDVVVSAPAQAGELRVLIDHDFFDDPNWRTALPDTRAVAGFLTGDESDDVIYLDDGSSKAATKAALARELWDTYPQLPVYNGAMTNRHIGGFAGMTDVQGIDFYAAACAPHVTPWGSNPPLRAPYDYLRNARDNHAPWPTWLYAQGLNDGWNKQTALGERVFQPDPQEIAVQAMMVVLAGGKGLMWFQSEVEEGDRLPARWQAIARANHTIRAVRRLLLPASVTGLARADVPDDRVLVEALRGPDALVVPVVNLFADTRVTDVACGTAQVAGVPAPPHWVLGSQSVDVVVSIPDDMGIATVFSVDENGTHDAAFVVDTAARTVTLPAVAVDNDTPTRLFVLAGDDAVRAQVDVDAAH